MQLLTTSAREPGEQRLRNPEPGFGPVGAARVRILLTAALGPLVIGYTAVAALLAVITATAENAQFSAVGVLLAAGPGWLAAHQVPVEISGHPLGMLPLLPTIGMGLITARIAAGGSQRLGWREPVHAIALAGVMAGAHALFGLVIALGSQRIPLQIHPIAAFLVPGLFAGLTATAGLAKRCGLVSAARSYLDPIALRGVWAGALGLAALLAGGAVVLTLSVALSTSTVHDLFAPGLGTDLGLFLLSVGYLPNAIVAGLSFAAGPGFSIGSVSINPIAVSGGQVPGVPLLAGIPAHHAVWWPALMLLPAAAGVLVGWSVRAIDEDPLARLRTVGVAGALVAFSCVVLGTLAGGRLGNGPFDPVSVPVGVASVVAFCWIVLPGGLVAFFFGPRRPASLPTSDLGEYAVGEELESEELLGEPAEADEVAEETDEAADESAFAPDSDADDQAEGDVIDSTAESVDGDELDPDR
jgi:hypothetical protein